MMQDKSFFDIVDDPDAFNFGAFNLFKVFHARFVFGRQLAGANVAWKPAGRPPLPRLFAARLLALFRGSAAVIRLGIASRRQPRTLFYGATGRQSRVEGATYDLYNARVVGERGRERFVLVEDTDDGVAKTYRLDFAFSDFALLIRLLAVLIRVLQRRRLREFAEKVTAAYPALGFSPAAAGEITAAFCANYLVNRLLVAWLAPERALLICHYGREPFIAACQRQGVPVTELMHGVISAGHPFYSYPPAYSHLFGRALFPNRIAVYGEYWRRILLAGHMFPSDSVVVAGYYLKVPAKSQTREARVIKRILITTQPTVQPELLDYIAFLKSTLDRSAWAILIKPHPSEDATAYRRLAEPDFVSIADRTTYALLAECDVHISVYSTVLYEAILYGACNYSLRVERYARICDEIAGSGVALALHPDEVPAPCVMAPGQVHYFLAEYRPDMLFGARPTAGAG
jgi:hypothetical protein